MITSLKVKDIDPTTHESLEFVSISIYFSELAKNDTPAFVFIIREIHLVNDLKVKMLIDNDLLNSEKFIIDVEKKSTTIDSCEINIMLEIQLKDPYLRRTIHAQQAMMLQSGQEQLLPIRTKIPNGRDFFFEPDPNANFTMCSHILDTSTKRILVKNEIEHAIKVSRRYRLDQISEIDCDNCFQISETDLAIRPPKERKYKTTFAHAAADNSSIIPSIDFADMKARLSNESMVYDNEKARAAYAKLIQEFPTLWQDSGFIDLSKDK